MIVGLRHYQRCCLNPWSQVNYEPVLFTSEYKFAPNLSNARKVIATNLYASIACDHKQC